MIFNGLVFLSGVAIGWLLFEKPEIVRQKLTLLKQQLMKLWRQIND